MFLSTVISSRDLNVDYNAQNPIILQYDFTVSRNVKLSINPLFGFFTINANTAYPFQGGIFNSRYDTNDVSVSIPAGTTVYTGSMSVIRRYWNRTEELQSLYGIEYTLDTVNNRITLTPKTVTHNHPYDNDGIYSSPVLVVIKSSF